MFVDIDLKNQQWALNKLNSYLLSVWVFTGISISIDLIKWAFHVVKVKYTPSEVTTYII